MSTSRLITVEQAVYTSVRGKLTSGYQLAASSPGVTSVLARELSRWGPAHDCLEDESPAARSVNFHALDQDFWCLSQTLPAGSEYSGRRGLRIVTQMFVISDESFRAFDFHPIRALQAIQANHLVNVSSLLNEELPTRRIRVPTRIPHTVDAGVVRRLDEFRAAIAQQQPLALQLVNNPPAFLKRLFDCLSTEDRRRLWFTTGLRHSLRRPFKLYLLPMNVRKSKLALAESGAAVFDLSFLEPSVETCVAKSPSLRVNPTAGAVPLHGCR